VVTDVVDDTLVVDVVMVPVVVRTVLGAVVEVDVGEGGGVGPPQPPAFQRDCSLQ